MRNNKKAVSAIVATVLLVLITVAAVGIVYGAIMPIIRQGMDSSQKCMDAQISVNTESGYTVYDAATKKLNVQVRGPEKAVEISAIQIKVGDDKGSSKMFTVKVGTTDPITPVPIVLPSVNEDKVYTIDLTAAITAGLGVPKTVGVAPIIKLGATDYICPMTTSVEI